MQQLVIHGFTMYVLFGGGLSLQTAQAVSATGGNSTNDVDGYRIHTFTTSGTLTITAGGDVEYLMVAGGGGGGGTESASGWNGGGGGGAGGMLTGVTNLTSSVSILVGAGGAGGTGTPGSPGSNGTNSLFGSVVAFGGGGGGRGGIASSSQRIGAGGGSGGGSGYTSTTAGAGTNGQGYAGGNSVIATGGAGGGGGADAAGGNGLSTPLNYTGGSGGAGRTNAITGTTNYYAGGGGGGGLGGYGDAGDGGLGGGGKGAKFPTLAAQAGEANTGGGGGGGTRFNTSQGNNPGAAGGSGIVIVRYLNALDVAANAASGIGTTNATIKGTVISRGIGENPLVYFCWGDTDAGTNSFPGTWAHTDSQGTNWGDGQAFSTNLTGLISGSNYVYRCYATNSTGQAWSSEVVPFQTCYLPAVTNIGFSDITINAVLLQGQITDTGGGDGAPAVWFSYWIDGDSVTSAVPMGAQTGLFSRTVGGLTGGANYTYQILASNAAGTAWSETNNFQTLPSRTNIWTGAADSDWFNTNNWDQLVVPIGGEVVIVTNTARSILLTNTTANLAFLTISNATLTCSNWSTTIRATDVTLRNQGKITLPGAFTYGTGAMSNRVHIIATRLLIETNSQIDVANKGYLVANGPAKGSQSGSNYNAGGGHGGSGGDENGGLGGTEWGVPETPVWPGSGGGQYSSTTGGNGGGVVRIEAEAVTVNGIITANGETGSQYNGGGAGGSIFITCDTFSGTNGIIRANGGNGGTSYDGGGAGGGRMAIDYQSIVGTCSVLFSTQPGALYTTIPARSGTLWLPDAALIEEGLETCFDQVRLVVPGWTSYTVGDLDINNRTVSFSTEGFTLTVTNNLTVRNNGSLIIGSKILPFRTLPAESTITNSAGVTVNVGGDVLVQGGSLVIGGLEQSGASYLNVAGHVTLTNAAANSGRLIVCAGNATGNDPLAGFVSITGALTVASNAWYQPYSHPTNGGSVHLQSASITVAAGGGLNADAAGFQSYRSISYGYGGGVGKSNGSRGGGGGHGGAGGRGSDGTSYGGSTNDMANRPLHPGSSGGFAITTQAGYGHGGGYVRIETGPLVLDGTISANGRNGLGSYGGGGAGGGIFIFCDSFEGSATGLISAKGGNGGTEGGGGGGGRVAMAIALPPTDHTKLIDGDEVEGLFVYPSHGPFLGSINVTNGTSSYTPLAQPGSAMFMTLGAGTFALVVEGNPGEYSLPQPLHYGATIGIAADSVLTNSVVTPDDEADGMRRACIGWNLVDEDENPVDDGTTSQAIFTLSTNMTLTWNWTNEYELTTETGPNGSVNSATVDGWYTNAVAAQITATASNDYHFIGWIGDVPEADRSNNPLTLVMDQPRTIQAEFGSIAGEAKTWSGTGAWSDYGNWDPPGAPGPDDTVTIASGNMLFPAPHTVKAATINSGATVVFTNWNAALTTWQDMTIAGTVTLPPPFVHPTANSNRVWFICRDFTLAETGVINADAKGWFVRSGIGKGGGAGSNYGSGAGHGGKGGASLYAVGGTIYGVTNAPLLPGSGGGGTYDYAGGHGGGAIWIDASRDVVVNGTITANGEVGPHYNPGGSGGSIFIIAEHSFAGGATGIIRADGGNRGGAYTTLGGGGGGRIAIWYRSIEPADRAVLMAGGLTKYTQVTGSLPTYLGAVTANAATLSHAPPEDGTVVFLRVAPPPGSLFMIR